MSGGWVEWNGAQIDRRYHDAVMGGLETTAERVIADAAQLTPVETGDLSGSGDVVLDRSETAAYAVMGQGDSAPYAVYQHETEGLNHPLGGGPHFLTRGLMQNASNLLRDIRASIARLT